MIDRNSHWPEIIWNMKLVGFIKSVYKFVESYALILETVCVPCIWLAIQKGKGPQVSKFLLGTRYKILGMRTWDVVKRYDRFQISAQCGASLWKASKTREEFARIRSGMLRGVFIHPRVCTAMLPLSGTDSFQKVSSNYFAIVKLQPKHFHFWSTTYNEYL